MSVVTSAMLNRILAMLDVDITHLGVGTGVEPGAGDTVLTGEAQRKAATSTIDGLTLIKEGYWDETEGNDITYTNTGVFGNGATGDVSTGELFAGGAIKIPKTNTQSMTVSVEITVEAV